MSTTFLSARWRHLIMLNYAVDPALLEPIVPRGTRLDMHDGQCWVSVVAFLFLDTKVLGVPVPGHRDFEELNLRFYVRRDVPDIDRGQPLRRGVAFVKEVVPRFAIATVARMLYNENYVALPMSHTVARRPGAGDVGDDLEVGDRVHIGFRQRGTTPEWGEVAATVAAAPRAVAVGSHEEFIAEHYWGYARQRGGGTVEYEVHHPAWRVHDVEDVVLTGDMVALYGAELGACLQRAPDSAFLAQGSEVRVDGGVGVDG